MYYLKWGHLSIQAVRVPGAVKMRLSLPTPTPTDLARGRFPPSVFSLPPVVCTIASLASP